MFIPPLIMIVDITLRIAFLTAGDESYSNALLSKGWMYLMIL